MPWCCQASSTVTAISASVGARLPVVAGHGHDLVAVERPPGRPGRSWSTSASHSSIRRDGSWIGEKKRRYTRRRATGGRTCARAARRRSVRSAHRERRAVGRRASRRGCSSRTFRCASHDQAGRRRVRVEHAGVVVDASLRSSRRDRRRARRVPSACTRPVACVIGADVVRLELERREGGVGGEHRRRPRNPSRCRRASRRCRRASCPSGSRASRRRRARTRRGPRSTSSSVQAEQRGRRRRRGLAALDRAQPFVAVAVAQTGSERARDRSSVIVRERTPSFERR